MNTELVRGRGNQGGYMSGVVSSHNRRSTLAVLACLHPTRNTRAFANCPCSAGQGEAGRGERGAADSHGNTLGRQLIAALPTSVVRCMDQEKGRPPGAGRECG